MTKTFVGPQLRQLRRERHQTQAEMAKVLGVSAGYVNLLENNERSLSLRLLMALADNYGVDWRDIVADTTSNLFAELRSVIKDPMFSAAPSCAGLSIMRRGWSSSSSISTAFIAIRSSA
jgi:transcriptional regulator with XRE-family HTH domain